VARQATGNIELRPVISWKSCPDLPTPIAKTPLNISGKLLQCLGERNERPDFYLIMGDDYCTEWHGIEAVKDEDEYFGKSNIHCYNGKQWMLLRK